MNTPKVHEENVAKIAQKIFSYIKCSDDEVIKFEEAKRSNNKTTRTEELIVQIEDVNKLAEIEKATRERKVTGENINVLLEILERVFLINQREDAWYVLKELVMDIMNNINLNA